MRRRRTILSGFTILLILLIIDIVYFRTNVIYDGEILFYVQSDNNTEIIKCWEDDDEKIYVFLPTYAQMSDVEIKIPQNSYVFIDDIALESGMSCDSFLLDKEYILSGDVGSEKMRSKIIFVQSENMPTMYIDTASGSMDYVHKEKGNKESGYIRLYTQSGEINYSGKMESIKGRGNTTWTASKKPYRLTLCENGNLLNMGAAENWILLSNAYDPSHLRNKMTYDFARKIGMEYVPECQWVDLYLNGEYVGLYLLSERNEIHEERVNLSVDSFLVSSELEIRLIAQNYPYIMTEKGVPLRIHDTGLSQNEIVKIWQASENAIFSETGTDPVTGAKWHELIDLDSWVRRFLMDEVFLNGDGGHLSQFYYYDASIGKIYAGPVWDMDYCLTTGENRYPFSIICHREHIMSEDDAPFYYGLYQKPEFYERTVELYQSVFQPVLSELLLSGFDEYQDLIDVAQKVDQLRWKTSDYQENINEMRSFLELRVQFLNDYWIKNERFYTVNVRKAGLRWNSYAIRPGSCMPPVFDEYEDGWYNLNTGEPFDFEQPIYENMTIYHRESYLKFVDEQKIKNDHETIQNANEERNKDEQERIPMQRKAPIVLFTFMLFGLFIFNVVQIKRSGTRYE